MYLTIRNLPTPWGVLNQDLEEGCHWQLKAPNGSGKTYFIKQLLAVIPIVEARIQWNCQYAYVGHENAIKSYLTPLEYLTWQQQMLKSNVDPAEILDFWHISSYKIIDLLSKGQQRRLALATLSLQRDKDVWVVDEASAHLDTQGKNLLQQLFQEHLGLYKSLITTDPC